MNYVLNTQIRYICLNFIDYARRILFCSFLKDVCITPSECIACKSVQA